MTTLPETKSILLELKDGWLTIWFNTPENRNALSSDLTDELMRVLGTVRDDRNVRGITLRGKGGIFCAGGDLKNFQAGFHGSTASIDDVKAMNIKGGEMFATINTMPQVVLVLVEGAAIAGGLGIVCCADIVAVTSDAKFSLTETQIGIAPAQIAPFVVQRLGQTTARRLMLTGARFTGENSKEIGLSDFIVNDVTGLNETQVDIQKSVMRCAPNANAITKEIVLAASKLTPEEMREFAADGFARCMLSDEGREGIASFIEKRKPRWAEQGRQ